MLLTLCTYSISTHSCAYNSQTRQCIICVRNSCLDKSALKQMTSTNDKLFAGREQKRRFRQRFQRIFRIAVLTSLVVFVFDFFIGSALSLAARRRALSLHYCHSLTLFPFSPNYLPFHRQSFSHVHIGCISAHCEGISLSIFFSNTITDRYRFIAKIVHDSVAVRSEAKATACKNMRLNRSTSVYGLHYLMEKNTLQTPLFLAILFLFDSFFILLICIYSILCCCFNLLR